MVFGIRVRTVEISRCHRAAGEENGSKKRKELNLFHGCKNFRVNNMLKKCMYVAAHKGLAGKSAAKVLQIMRKKGEL